jgi:hypothetical protein
MPVPPKCSTKTFQARERRLRNDGLNERSRQLLKYAPGARPGQATRAQRGESSSASTSGSSNRIISKCANTHGLAERSSEPGGFFRQIRLFNLLERFPISLTRNPDE